MILAIGMDLVLMYCLFSAAALFTSSQLAPLRSSEETGLAFAIDLQVKLMPKGAKHLRWREYRVS